MRHVSERALLEAVLVTRLVENMCDGRPTKLLQRVIEFGGGKQEPRRKHVPAKHPPLRIWKADLCDSEIDEILRFRRTRGTVILHRKRPSLLGVRPEVSRRLFANNVLGYQRARLIGTPTHVYRNPTPILLARYSYTKGATSFEVVNSEPDRCVEIVNDIEPRSSYSVVLKNRPQIGLAPPRPLHHHGILFQLGQDTLVGPPQSLAHLLGMNLATNGPKERWGGPWVVPGASTHEDPTNLIRLGGRSRVHTRVHTLIRRTWNVASPTKCNERGQHNWIRHVHVFRFALRMRLHGIVIFVILILELLHDILLYVTHVLLRCNCRSSSMATQSTRSY